MADAKEMYHYNLGLRFQHVAALHANRTALRFNAGETVTYAALNSESNRAAHWLAARGVEAGDLVCLAGVKTRHTIACMIGCLKLGAAYCMLDPDSPVERLRKILETCRPALVLGDRDFHARSRNGLEDAGIRFELLTSEVFDEAISNGDDENPPFVMDVTGDRAAYVMFTSGSTGFPKGAVMTHANVLNLINWSQATYAVRPDDILTNVNPLYFDNSVFDLYTALFSGACMVPFTKEEVRDPKLLVDKVDEARCTVWFSVPSLLMFLQTMKATDGRHLRSIRRFIFGGEKYPKSKLKNLFDLYSNSSEFHNVYGPTECTCICSSYRISGEDFRGMEGLPPLGHLAPNFSFLILDERGKRVEDGGVGELCLLGPNVGKGYYNDPVRTAASFIQNPMNTAYPEVMYKTGDLVRFDPRDGKLYIEGRRDNQIKHMGYRIELEEIEAAMHQLEYVSEAAAVHSENGGLSRIIAVVASSATFTDDQIRRDLRQLIPEYMIPSTFNRETALPKNANGKVDRVALHRRYAGKA
jgi:D-alanine--poly(phosphoribitol) ligase subunit 1